MPVNCAWCGARLGEEPGLAGESHGICAACEKANFPKRPDLPDQPPAHDGSRA